MSLGFKIHGTRGSRPSLKPYSLRYGGNSSSYEILTDEKYLVFIDAGSGLAKAGRELGSGKQSKELHILTTHPHWDHILGFTDFEPFFCSENRIVLYGAGTELAKFKNLFLKLGYQNYLPIPISAFKAKIDFVEVCPGQSFFIGERIAVSTFQLNHNGITLGYRITYKGKSISVITDNAPIENENYLFDGIDKTKIADFRKFEMEYNNGLTEFIRNSQLALFDTHFNEENLRPDWGHGTPEIAAGFCVNAGVKMLLLGHHAPEDTDEDVDAKLVNVRRRYKDSGLVIEAGTEEKIWKVL
ncbi:MAG: hypothetical protein HQK54_11250, partial [Oligoflexales bacterium]|nr:hypothetical protein [Oligoflexales bacterium]